ncbi:glycosyltransferase [Gulosibacter hominis]|uniref:glycosyltransferase n=1 Tax=Gulosibacter hominis TaxID=2770504 RepID=UPI0019197061|nr:glycosyltransferase [Gulosibacter hominis]
MSSSILRAHSPSPPGDGDRPRILVLLATHNGQEFLDEQLNSVLSQADVDVTVLVSDDASTDQTIPMLAQRAETDSRVALLEPGQFGSAAKNFARLIRDADPTGFDAVALCDQDDIWRPGKLRRHFDILSAPRGLDGLGSYSAVSSNVTAFAPDGTRQLIVKNQTQQLADYAFESGGPGSTFLIRPEAFRLVQQQLRNPQSSANTARSHDWLIYALIRANGGRWFIDGEPTVEYRQHEDNVLGANEGWRQHLRRLAVIREGTYRADVANVVVAALEVADAKHSARLHWIATQIETNSLRSRLRLARRARHLRRRRRDQLVLAATIALGIW